MTLPSHLEAQEKKKQGESILPGLGVGRMIQRATDGVGRFRALARASLVAGSNWNQKGTNRPGEEERLEMPTRKE